MTPAYGMLYLLTKGIANLIQRTQAKIMIHQMSF